MKLYKFYPSYGASIEEYKKALTFTSFEEYQKLGGTRTLLSLYSKIKEYAKQFEGDYISFVDMSISGIPVNIERAHKILHMAQANWTALHIIFGEPLRTVSYDSFSLTEFNKL